MPTPNKTDASNARKLNDLLETRIQEGARTLRLMDASEFRHLCNKSKINYCPPMSIRTQYEILLAEHYLKLNQAYIDRDWECYGQLLEEEKKIFKEIKAIIMRYKINDRELSGKSN